MNVRRQLIERPKPEWCSFTKRTMIRLRRSNPRRFNQLVVFLYRNEQ